MERPILHSNNDSTVLPLHGVRSAGRVRKRISNACNRCRQQKIKCPGQRPCEQCSRRNVPCVYEVAHQKVLVTRRYLDHLEGRITGNDDAVMVVRGEDEGGNRRLRSSGDDRSHGMVDSSVELDQDHVPYCHDVNAPLMSIAGSASGPQTLHSARRANTEDGISESEAEDEESRPNSGRVTPESSIRNPIDPGNSDSFAVSTASKHYFLGVSSNWSFGLRVFKMVHDKTHSQPLSSADLFFEGCTYDLGWDGQRHSAAIDVSALPTADFALFLINAVKFRCGCLFHMFDEQTFMQTFKSFYDGSTNQHDIPKLWVVHFLILLAFGKAFTVRSSGGLRPPGSELFVQAMQHLPDITSLHLHPLQSIEILCCAALYLQCLDLRSAAYNIIGQAMRLALEQGMHTDLRSRHLSEDVIERCREAWWTVFVLDRQMTSLMGVPMGISDDDITARLPSFGGSSGKLLAIDLHVKLAKAQAVVSQTVYGKTGRKAEKFLSSMKDALKTIAAANDQRNESFPIDLRSPTSSISRISAYLHLFHHQALILATRPLLFSFLQKRLESSKRLRISSSNGAKSLLRVCVSSAIQCLNILEVLHAQNLLETFIPFDLEATFTSALVLTIASAVNPSLTRGKSNRVDIAFVILDEMKVNGNLIASHHKRELEQLRANLSKLENIEASDSETSPTAPDPHTTHPDRSRDDSTAQTTSSFDGVDGLLPEWKSDDGVTGEHLMAVADSINLDEWDWSAWADLDQPIDMYHSFTLCS